MTVFDLTGPQGPRHRWGQGLGEGMAQALAAAGAKVVVADLQDDLGPKVAEALGEGHGFVHLDVTDDANWEAAVADAAGQLGGLDIVVNNAGIEITSLLVDLDPDEVTAPARGQPPRHRARHQARLPRDAPRRRGRQRRRDHQHRVGRRDHRLPRHRASTPRRSPVSTGSPGSRRWSPGSSATACGSTASTPGLVPTAMGAGLANDVARDRAVPVPGGGGRRGHRADARGPARRGRPTWPTPSSSSPPTPPGSSPAPGWPSTAGWGCDRDRLEHRRHHHHQARRRLRGLRLHRPPHLRVPARVQRPVRRGRSQQGQAHTTSMASNVPGIETADYEIAAVEHDVESLTELFRGRVGRLQHRRAVQQATAPRSSRRASPRACTTSTPPGSRTGSSPATSSTAPTSRRPACSCRRVSRRCTRPGRSRRSSASRPRVSTPSTSPSSGAAARRSRRR